MTELLERLQRKADVGILDGPPLFILDAQVLASKIGGVLLIIQQGETRTSMARSMKEQLRLMNISLLGVVMNRVPRAEAYYYEGYYAEPWREKPKEIVKEVEAT